ncbi:MAG: helix-turn-helix domain-containing protein [Deltaproteobacteria bacterium]|nr:helix-turn-helix domain-containing protein [Deltaproteobacteria bacterium]
MQTTGRNITPEELAAVLGIPVETVHLWIESGMIPYRMEGGTRIFNELDLKRWLEEKYAALTALDPE